ncbi:DUF2971 domain-containing protein [Desulfosarcina ovata]|uniref:DUF2971 domain-containing protein n=1 Tax=Desulfosarcina ovata subsp. ovata TaxID=2752305 RepID=A0A5K8AKC3_9BACT|nr:DUF2971 domain-containing protein [Desulfosarcina ovata]BBO93177.1 hypothetical protein DSCOOX_63570 [Desulfosarcina ovata subsp. ovata]
MIEIEKYFESKLSRSLYHYTGIGSLLGISKSNSLWASSVYYVNDGEEIIFAQKKLISLVEKKIKTAPEVVKEFLVELIVWLKAFTGGAFNLFVFSMSEERSLLSQWRSYTPHGKGVSIEFTQDIIEKIKQNNDLQLTRVRYEQDEQMQILETLLNAITKKFVDQKNIADHYKKSNGQNYQEYLEKFRGDVLTVFSTIKNPAFKEEKEWRLISKYYASYMSPRIKYREGASMLVPYMEFELERFYDNPLHSHPVFFKSVCLGPTVHSEMSINALSQFLSNQRIAHETINSNIPYREW